METKVANLLRQPVSWIADAGPEDDIVISTRIRLARNLSGMPFPVSGNMEILRRVRELCMEAIAETETIVNPLDLDYQVLNPTDRQFLLERRLISKEFLHATPESALVAETGESVSIMINEEDHLRIQAFSPGFQLPAVWDRVNAMDDNLSAKLPFAFDEKLGYLTACPTNLGTGMRASAMLHLPGLVLSGQIQAVIQGISKLGMAVRGFYGESTPYTGNLYQISNQSSLGESEIQIIDRLAALIEQIILHEKKAREFLLARRQNFLLNHVGRAYGILRHGYLISSEEALNSLSALRLGVDMGMFSSVDIHTVNGLFLIVQPAHLTLNAGRELDKDGRDEARASIIRETLKARREKS